MVNKDEQGVALKRRNRIGPPCNIDRPTAHAPAALQTTTDDADIRQRAKQYWPIRRASNKQPTRSRLLHTLHCYRICCRSM